MASLFNFCNIVKKMECQTDAQDMREGWSLLGLRALAAVSLRSSTGERIHTGDPPPQEGPAVTSVPAKQSFPSLPLPPSLRLWRECGRWGPQRTSGRKTAPQFSLPRLPAGTGKGCCLPWREVWNVNHDTTRNILTVRMKLFMCLDGVRALKLLLRF